MFEIYNLTDAQNSDYDPTPTPGLLTIRKDQERDCSNITILDDTIVEEDEEFGVAIATTMTTFTAGVNIVRNQSTVVIEDDDGKKDPFLLYWTAPYVS